MTIGYHLSGVVSDSGGYNEPTMAMCCQWRLPTSSISYKYHRKPTLLLQFRFSFQPSTFFHQPSGYRNQRRLTSITTALKSAPVPVQRFKSSTMDPGRPIQAFEEPFDMADYVNFDVEDNNSNPTTIAASTASMAEPFENVNVNGRTAHYGGMVDPNFAGMSQLPQHVNPMDLQLDVAPVASAGLGGSNAFQAPVATPATSHANCDAMDIGSEQVLDMVDPFGVPVDFSPTYCNSLTMSPTQQGLDMTDNFQNPMGADGTLDDFSGGNLMAFPDGVDLTATMKEMEQLLAMDPNPQEWNPTMTNDFQNFDGGVDLTAQEMAQLPSMWMPVLPELQQQLNSEFAPQPGLFAADPSPPPALFLPAEGVFVHPVSNFPFLGAGNFPVDPRLVVQGTDDLSSAHLPPAGTCAPVPADAGAFVLATEDQALHSTIIPGTDTDVFQLQPASNRGKMAEILPATLEDMEFATLEDMEFDDEDDWVVTGAATTPTVVKDEDYDGTLDADGEPDSEYVFVNADSSDPVAAHATSSLPSHEEGDHHHAIDANVGGNTYNCKTQKMLKEIEDTKGFAGAQGVEVGVNGRPVRKEAKKNYEGQE